MTGSTDGLCWCLCLEQAVKLQCRKDSAASGSAALAERLRYGVPKVFGAVPRLTADRRSDELLKRHLNEVASVALSVELVRATWLRRRADHTGIAEAGDWGAWSQ